MLACDELAIKTRHVPGVQMNDTSGDFAAMARHIAGGPGGNRQLFLQLADQRFPLALSGLHFAPGKFPQPGLIGMRWTLGEKNFAILFNNSGNNINRFQHSGQRRDKGVAILSLLCR